MDIDLPVHESAVGGSSRGEFASSSSSLHSSFKAGSHQTFSSPGSKVALFNMDVRSSLEALTSMLCEGATGRALIGALVTALLPLSTATPLPGEDLSSTSRGGDAGGFGAESVAGPRTGPAPAAVSDGDSTSASVGMSGLALAPGAHVLGLLLRQVRVWGMDVWIVGQRGDRWALKMVILLPHRGGRVGDFHL